MPELVRLGEVVDRHRRKFDDISSLPVPSHNDELELVGGLIGLGRWIEINVRIAYELLCKRPSQGVTYTKVLKALGEKLDTDKEPNLLKALDMLKCCLIATDGLAHGNMPTVVAGLDRAYRDHNDVLKLPFPLVSIVETTITRNGLNLTIQGLDPKAVDSKGATIPAKARKPEKTEGFESNVKEFYQGEMFANLFELQHAAVNEAVKFREEIRRLRANSST